MLIVLISAEKRHRTITGRRRLPDEKVEAGVEDRANAVPEGGAMTTLTRDSTIRVRRRPQKQRAPRAVVEPDANGFDRDYWLRTARATAWTAPGDASGSSTQSGTRVTAGRCSPCGRDGSAGGSCSFARGMWRSSCRARSGSDSQRRRRSSPASRVRAVSGERT
jgi:hypothetical protein